MAGHDSRTRRDPGITRTSTGPGSVADPVDDPVDEDELLAAGPDDSSAFYLDRQKRREAQARALQKAHELVGILSGGAAPISR